MEPLSRRTKIWIWDRDELFSAIWADEDRLLFKFLRSSCSVRCNENFYYGSGKLGQLLELKDASLPDHAHRHRHKGSKTYSIAYKKGPDGIGTKKKGHDSSYASDAHQHNINAQTSVNVNFADMSEESALMSNFKVSNSNMKISSNENELYSPHMRVTFMFKCY